jgi:CrcB protein
VREGGLALPAVAAGGALGAWARLGLAAWFPVAPGHWPWATFVANLAGCALLAALVGAMRRTPPSGTRAAFLGAGLCGALTTFSTLQLEVVDLARDGHPALGAAYLAASLTAGLAVAAGAMGAARRVVTA